MLNKAVIQGIYDCSNSFESVKVKPSADVFAATHQTC